MGDLIVSNNATSTLAAALDAVSTQLSINSTDAKLFPYITEGRWCPLTIVDNIGGYEIVHATKRVGGIFTVTRGQENTQARDFPVGSRVDLRLTSAIIDELANKFIVDSRLPQRLHPKNMWVPDNNANDIVENGTYETYHYTQNCALNEQGMLRHSGNNTTTDAIQEWTALYGTRRYIRMKRDGRWTGWSEITIQPDRLSPWAMKVIGEPFPLMDFIGNVGQPPRDKQYRFVKLSAYDSYNNGVLVSETVRGTDPYIQAWATIQCSGSPINGQTIHLINTERHFLRAGNPGAFEDSQNKWHSHSGRTTENGEHNHAYSKRVDTNDGPDGDNGWAYLETVTDYTSVAGRHSHELNIYGDGGNEARPRNMGINYYMRIM